MSSGLPAIVKAGIPSKAAGLLGISMEEFLARGMVMSPSGVGILVPASSIKLLSAKKEGDAANTDGTLIKANQHALAILPLHDLMARRYSFAVSVNPAIFSYAQVSLPSLVAVRDLRTLTVLISAHKAVDPVEDLDWLVELTAID